MRRLLRLPFVLALLALLAAVSCGGAPATREFATRAEAGQVVAPWVPADATDLRLATEEGSGAFWLRFRLPKAGRTALEPDLVRIPDSQVATLTFRAPKGVEWWFRGLVHVVPARETTVIAADVHSGKGTVVPQRTFVAFERASDLVYAWQASR